MNLVSRLLIGWWVCFGVTGTSAQESPRHQASFSEWQEAVVRNHEALLRWEEGSARASRPVRPVEEVANYQYLLITGSHAFGGAFVKETLARNLPLTMKLVVLVDPFEIEEKRAEFSQWIAPERLILAVAQSSAQGYWARDSFPFPVFVQETMPGLVAAKYFRPFSAQEQIAAAVGGSLTARHEFTFVGGNLQADSDGNCFVVDSKRLFGLTPAILEDAYGCSSVTLLPHVSGIGDVDEVLKILPGRKLLTTIPEYRTRLEALGYQVALLPKAGGFRTHANSLILGSLVYMPAYHQESDDVAKFVYESLGYQVVSIDSRDLSDRGNGSLHCITMAYPPMSERQLLMLIGAQRF